MLPYSLTSIERNNHAYGINKAGLARKGFTSEQIKELRSAFRLLTASKMNTSQALEAINAKIAEGAGDGVRYLAEFVQDSQRGVIK